MGRAVAALAVLAAVTLAAPERGLADRARPDAPTGSPRLRSIVDALFSRGGEPHLARLAGRLACPGRCGDRFLRVLRRRLGDGADMEVGGMVDDWVGRVAGRGNRVVPLLNVARHVANELSDHTDRNGHVDTASFVAQHGPQAAALLAALERVPLNEAERERSMRRQTLFAGTTFFIRLRQEAASRPGMATFEALVAKHAGARPLDGFRVLAVQHVLASTAQLLRAWRASGVPAHDIFVLGKRYSQDPVVTSELWAEGFGVETPRGDGRDVLAAAGRLIEAARREPGRRFLLVDDGGELLQVVNDYVTRTGDHDLARRIVGVEQTRRGIRRLEGTALHFPVVDVAQAWAKLTYESPLIGRSVVNAVEERMAELRQVGLNPERRATVIGAGAVGTAIARDFLRRGYRVTVWDTSPSARQAAARVRRLTVATSLEEALAASPIVVSATGAAAIDERAIDQVRPGAVFFNAGSGDSEIAFDVARLTVAHSPEGTTRLPFAGRLLPASDLADAGRADRVIRTRRGDVLLAAGGQVINFGGRDPIPARFIQLTRGLLFLGALQAARATTPGIQPLASAPQRDLVAALERELALLGESLEAPRF